MYTKSQQKEIEKVMDVFHNYIKENHFLDIIWSDKAGYVLLDGIDAETNTIAMAPEVVTDSHQLCKSLIFFIICDALKAKGRTTDSLLWGPEEKDIIREALKPYWEQLPEYKSLEEEICC